MDYKYAAETILNFAHCHLYGVSCLLLSANEDGRSFPKWFEKSMADLGYPYSFLDFEKEVEGLKPWLDEDVEAAYRGDPSAQSKEEIISSFPGFYAILAHRLAHILYLKKIPILPRAIAEIAHSKTGIDIHPGAKIGHRFFIDHGTGIVIGETTEIGDDVRIYQGVTLGAKSLANADSLRGKKRHPTILDRVIIYAGASILGGDTVIGNDVTIGSNIFLTSSIPDGKIVLFQPSGILIQDKK